MSAETGGGWLYSLRWKLVAFLVPLMTFCLVMAIVVLGANLKKSSQRRAAVETARLGEVLELALRQSMLTNAEQSLNASLADVDRTPGILRVWIIDKNGRVAHANDQAAVGRVLDRNSNPICTVCHGGRLSAGPRTVFTQTEAGIPILRYVKPIANESECWTCHDSQNRLNGILLLDDSLQPSQAVLRMIGRLLGATGGLTLLALTLVTLLVTTVLVQQPVGRLIAGVRRLGAGDMTARVPVHGRGELAELASSFNGMADALSHSLQEVRQKNVELAEIYSILERFTRTINLSELKEIVLQTVLDVFEADRVQLLSNLTADESGEVLTKLRGEARLYRVDSHADQSAAKSDGFPIEIAERWSQGDFPEPVLTSDQQTAIIPIRAGDRQLALLAAWRGKPFRNADAVPKMSKALAGHIGVGFENARLYSLAISDELTRLFNRRHFETRIAGLLSRYQEFGEPFGLILLDLDHFKAINDRTGHLAGDEVLRQTGRVLLRTIRLDDSAYRYGGEEFAVLLPEADSAITRVVAERVREEMSIVKVPLTAGPEIKVTASLGIAVCPDSGSTVQDLLAAADAALYRSKSEGRNRVSGLAEEA